MNFETALLKTPEIYRLLVGGVTPRPIAWISTVSEDGVHNIAPYSFFSVVSVNPPILSYTQVNPQSGEDKDTLKNLQATGECVVHIVSSDNLEKMNLSCADLAHSESEFDYAKIDYVASQVVAARSVADAPVRYECTLKEVIRMGENPGSGSLVLLDVKHVYVADELLKDGQIDQSKLDSIGKMGGDFYSFTSELKALARSA